MCQGMGTAAAAGGLSEGAKMGVTAGVGAAGAAGGAMGLISGLTQMRRAQSAAGDVRDLTAMEARRLMRDRGRQVATLRARMAGGGTLINEGTALQVVGNQLAESELDRRLVMHRGNLIAHRMEHEGRQAMIGGISSLLGGTGRGAMGALKIGSELGLFGDGGGGGGDETTMGGFDSQGGEDFGMDLA